MNERPVLLLLCVILAIRVVTLPILPLTDNTEARYGTVTKDMLKSGNWITPRVWIDGKQIPYLGKPPLHFWAAALSTRLFGMNEFALRFPSLVGAVIVVILMIIVLQRYVDRDLAYPAALILSSCSVFFGFAGAVIIDMSLTFCIAGATFSYLAFQMEAKKGLKRLWSLCFSAFLGLGFLIKGPVTMVMFGIPVFLWTLIHRKWSTLKDLEWFFGIPLFLLLTVPWYWAAEIRNPGFLRYFFLHENFLRFFIHKYGDLYGSGRSLPYGTAAVLFFLAGLPWTLWCAILLFRSQRWKWIKSFFNDERTSIFALGIVGIGLFLCLARQLVMPYVLPILPLFAVWATIFLKKSGVRKTTVMRLSMAFITLYGIAYPLALPQVEKRYSTKSMVRIAEDTLNHSRLNGGLVFVPSVPYSAYFYGQDLAIPHAKEGTALTIMQGLNSGKDHLYVVKQEYLGEIPPSVLGKLESVCVFGPWTLYRTK
jgi:4-amino-4-deoxy-L-arabinose transferase-like glycosyltransferase